MVNDASKVCLAYPEGCKGGKDCFQTRLPEKKCHLVGSVIVFNFSLPYSASPSNTLAYHGSKEDIMPHVSVKMYPGRSEKEKAELAEAITQAVMDIIGAGRNSISIAIEDISPQEWKEKVYESEIMKKYDTFYIKPGYSM
jgi:4-oxalocrotonate tautomerase